jgi:uncharacterized protein (DUF433 family)
LAGLDRPAAHDSCDAVLRAFPELTREDLRAALLPARAFMESTDVLPPASPPSAPA